MAPHHRHSFPSNSSHFRQAEAARRCAIPRIVRHLSRLVCLCATTVVSLLFSFCLQGFIPPTLFSSSRITECFPRRHSLAKRATIAYSADWCHPRQASVRKILLRCDRRGSLANSGGGQTHLCIVLVELWVLPRHMFNGSDDRYTN